jgi:hypothetical protein
MPRCGRRIARSGLRRRRGLRAAGAVGLRARVYDRRNAACLREALGLPPLDEAPQVLAEAVVR